VCTEKFTHGLRNLWLGHFIVARLLWAAGYAQGRYTLKKNNQFYLNYLWFKIQKGYLDFLKPFNII
jgi:hypothetical protein